MLPAPELLHHQEEQSRLAEELRRQEQQLQGYRGYSSHPQPLFGSGGRGDYGDHVKTILPSPPTGLIPYPPPPHIHGSVRLCCS